MKRTKIIATIGPASSSKEVLTQMIQEGVNVCRLNFSHGAYEEHAKIIATIREINEELNLHTALLVDLQGPKIRVGEVENNGITLVPAEKITITTDKCVGTKERVSINYKELPKDVQPGEKILLDDGKLTFEVVSSNATNEIICTIIHGGTLSSKKGVNLPNTKISLPSLTEKDKEDLDFAIQQNVDWIGLSFVRNARDIIELKHIIAKDNAKAKVVAKIEKPEAIQDIDEIIAESDALMVARGDLGVEIPFQNVPLLQKMIITKSMNAAKPVIVATQMMESMISNSSPTRAEVNDVANAVLDGADAVMLSGETSVGAFPVETIKAMSNIIKEMETFDGIYNKEVAPIKNNNRFISDSICFNACRLEQRVDAQAIITVTFSGYTAFKIASQRPKAKIYVFTSNRQILTQMNLIWGVKGFYYDKHISTDHTIADIKYILKKEGMLELGDLVINVATIPLEEDGKTNMLKLSYVE
jgi:pyruvate kinase